MSSGLIDLRLLAGDVKAKRADRSLRPVAKEIGISTATLCRIEGGEYSPDLESYAKTCDWIGVGLNEFYTGRQAEPKKRDGEALLIGQVLTDRTLREDTKRALVVLIALCYKAQPTATESEESDAP